VLPRCLSHQARTHAHADPCFCLALKKTELYVWCMCFRVCVCVPMLCPCKTVKWALLRTCYHKQAVVWKTKDWLAASCEVMWHRHLKRGYTHVPVPCMYVCLHACLAVVAIAHTCEGGELHVHVCLASLHVQWVLCVCTSLLQPWVGGAAAKYLCHTKGQCSSVLGALIPQFACGMVG